MEDASQACHCGVHVALHSWQNASYSCTRAICDSNAEFAHQLLPLAFFQRLQASRRHDRLIEIPCMMEDLFL